MKTTLTILAVAVSLTLLPAEPASGGDPATARGAQKMSEEELRQRLTP